MILILLLAMNAQLEQCGTCHPEQRVQHESSIHGQELTGCTACHGGNAESLIVEVAHGGDFKRRLSRQEIPTLCASCHSDPKRMRPYNLSTEQFALYQTSRHGQMLAQGDTRVAVCTDCHGTHQVLTHDNPESRVFIRNIPQTCAHCHADPALSARYGKEPHVYQEYLGSVHGRELLEKENENAPECSRCHGVHGALPPGIGDVEKVCGSCHSAALRGIRAGPHASAMAEAGLPECISCHDSHAVGTVHPERAAETCLACHNRDSNQYALGEQIQVLLQRADQALETARLRIEEAEGIPLDVADYRARLKEAQTYLRAAGPAFHTVSVEAVESFTRPARSIGEEIQAGIEAALSDLSMRRVGIVIFWFYLLITVVVLYRYRTSLLGRAE